VERLVALPQAIITTTALSDLVPRLVKSSTCQEITRGANGSEVRNA
jgi:hypothetical protein